MNEWLKDVVADLNKAKEDQKAQAARLDVIRQQTARVFGDLRVILQDAVIQMIKTPEIRERVGQLEDSFGYTDRVEINRRVLPAIYLTVRQGVTTIDISRRTIRNHSGSDYREEKESLDVDLDAKGNPVLKNKEGEILLLDEAVGYILKPTIFPELLNEPKRSGAVIGRILG